MKRLISVLLFVALFAMTSTGCMSLNQGYSPSSLGKSDPFGVRYLAQTLKEQLRDPDVVKKPVVVTTFVDLNKLNRSSVFGRVLAEQLLNELHHAGFTVSEIRKGKSVFMRAELGELILSRDTREVMSRSQAAAVLAGTYVATAESVIISARLLDVKSPLVISSCSYKLPMTTELEKLLTGDSPF